jgi:hypothetical protein
MNLPIQERIARLEAKHGTLPPPWVAFDWHPYSLGWRMGDREDYERDLKDPRWFKPKWPKKNKFTDG